MGPSMRAVGIDGKHLSVAGVVAAARGRAPVKLLPSGRARAAAAHATMLNVVKNRPVYGQTTGVGSNKTATITADAASDHGQRLLHSHAVGAGPAVAKDITRATMVIRLNQLAAGGAGVNPRLLDVLVVALNQNRLPQLKRYGAIGTGDLTMLSTLALSLSRKFENTDALAFMSSNAATLGEAALACADIQQRLNAGLRVAALTYIATGGGAEAFAEVVSAEASPGQVRAARKMRQLLGKDLYRQTDHVQDSYGLRALPQVHGAALDAVSRLEQSVTQDSNAAHENPLVSPAHHAIYHNGNFHAVQLGLDLDNLRASLYQTAALSVARLQALLSPKHTSLRPFLADGPEADSGLLIVEYVAQSALAELRHLAQPDSLATATLSHGTEDHASFATQSAWHTTACLAPYETILACECLAAVTALKQQKVKPNGSRLRNIYEVSWPLKLEALAEHLVSL